MRLQNRLLLNYSNINDIRLRPLVKFMQYGDLSHLNRLNIGLFVNKETADELVNQYMSGIGNNMYELYKRKRQELEALKEKLTYVRTAYILLCHGKKEVPEKILKKYRVKSLDLHKINLELKKTIVEIEIKETEFRNFTKDENKKVNIEDSIIDGLMHLSKYQGYHLDYGRIKAGEYCRILKNYNTEAKKVNNGANVR